MAVPRAEHARPGRPWTMEDVEALADDGQRYEVVDGSLLVAPMDRLMTRKRLDGSSDSSTRRSVPAGARIER